MKVENITVCCLRVFSVLKRGGKWEIFNTMFRLTFWGFVKIGKKDCVVLVIVSFGGRLVRNLELNL